jgi:hypothetical protein
MAFSKGKGNCGPFLSFKKKPLIELAWPKVYGEALIAKLPKFGVRCAPNLKVMKS